MFSFKNTVYEYKNQYLTSLEEVLNNGIGMLGPKVFELENQLSIHTGANYTYCCHSGTIALSLALSALNIGYGDEVITTPFSWISTVSTIVHQGAIPVFVDIDETDYNIDISKLENAITKKTKCVMIVNIFGKLIKNIDLLHRLRNKYKFYIIEDAAQSFGAFDNNYKSCDGVIGDIACTSFYPTKPLSGFGDGGACFTNNKDIAKKIKLLRNHGMDKYAEPELLGYNARMNEFQAAIILVNLKNFKQKTENRLKIAKLYNEKIIIDCVKPIVNTGDMVAQYCLLIKDRDKFIEYLNFNNIPNKIFYHKSLADQEIFKKYKLNNLPICEKICNNIVSIPCYDNIEILEVNRYIDIITNYVN